MGNMIRNKNEPIIHLTEIIKGNRCKLSIYISHIVGITDVRDNKEALNDDYEDVNSFILTSGMRIYVVETLEEIKDRIDVANIFGSDVLYNKLLNSLYNKSPIEAQR